MSLSDVVKSLEENYTYTKDVTIGRTTFGISLLTYEQDQLINTIPEEEDNALSFYERTKLQVLSYALTKIAGEIIPLIVEIDNGGKIETKERSIYVREVLKKLPPKIIEKLFEVYIDFKDEIDTMLSNEVEYKWFKTPEARKAERDKKESEVESKEPAKEEGESAPDGSPIVFTKIEEKDDEVAQG